MTVAPLAIIVWKAAEPFASCSVPATLPSVPSDGVAVNAGPAPAKTCPAAPVMDMAPPEETATGAIPDSAPPDVVVAHVGQVRFPVVALSTSGDDAPTAKVPVVLGRVRVGDPAVACG